MKVFVLTSEYTNVDSGEFVVHTYVFNTFNKANDLMHTLINAQKQFFGKTCDYETSNYVDRDMYFEIYEKDCFTTNHCILRITECEVN